MENKKFHDKFGQEFKTGDIIEFKSFFHTHWGVYIGNGMFIDSRPGRKTSLYNTLLRRRLVQVMKRKLDLGDEKGVLRNNFMDNIYEPRKPDEIVKTAEAFLDIFVREKQDFSKQFVVFCRYNRLPQSKKALGLGEVVTAAMLGGITGYTFGRVVPSIRRL